MAFHRTVKSSRRPAMGTKKKALETTQGPFFSCLEGGNYSFRSSLRKSYGRATSSSWPSSLQEPFSWPCSSWPSLPFSSLPFLPPRSLVHPTSPSLHRQAPPPPHMLVSISNLTSCCQRRAAILENFFYFFSHSIQGALGT